MEISFENSETTIYREYFSQTRRTQESAECVVPDTDADIEKVAAVQSAVTLKSKDLTGHGVLISGELAASVLYIPEGQESLSFVRLRKPFSIEYEVEDPASETLTQITLSIQGTDVRLVNPRKLLVQFDVEGALSCYRSEKLCVQSALPEDAPGLHVRMEEHTLTLPNAVCEKSVALNEQFGFLKDSRLPARLVSEKADLLITDSQLIGSKVIVKGSAALTVVSQSEEGELVVSAFNAPFSQIIDIGVDHMSACAVRAEITGAYFDLVDTINGEKALDMELHAVLQLVCSEQRTVSCVADAYSNLMPTELISARQEYELSTGVQRRQLSAEERISLMENCGELLQVFLSTARVTPGPDKLSAAVNLDFLYRNGEGRMSAVRRTVALTQETEGETLRVLYVRPTQFSATPDGDYVNCSVALELGCVSCEKIAYTSIGAVVLDEDQVYIQEALPTLTLVRAEGESLWALAKKYHSSEEKIRQFNEDAENAKRMLLIPKCV